MLLTCLLAVLGSTAQEPAVDPGIPARIEALIAKTNAYEGFIARYRAFDTEGNDYTFRIVFRSPRELVIDVVGENSRYFSRTLGDALDNITIKGKADVVKASIRDASAFQRYTASVRARFEKRFPGVLRADELPKADKLYVGLQETGNGGHPTLNSGDGPATFARLHWLDEIHGQPGVSYLDRDGAKEIVFQRPDGIRIFVSSESGFLVRTERNTDAGPRTGLELASLDVGSRPLDSEFELPPLGEGVRDNSDELQAAVDGSGFLATRTVLFSTLARAVDDGRLKWKDDTLARVEDVVRGLHQSYSDHDMADQLAIGIDFVDKKIAGPFRDWLRAQDLKDPQTQTVGSEWVRKAGTDLLSTFELLREESCSDDRLKGTCRQPLKGACKIRPSLYEDLAALEKRVQTEIFTESVIKPLLVAFDEKVAKQLEAK